jgi:hypothetical protein
MKSVILILILAVSTASADIGTDFLIDNILNPLINGIYDNTVGFLIGSIFDLFKPQGKRDIGMLALTSQVAGFFQTYKQKLIEVIKKAVEKFQLLSFNLLNTPDATFSQVLADAVTEMRAASLALLDDLYTVFQSIFGQKFLNSEAARSRSVFGNLANILNDFTQIMEQTLGSYGQVLAEAVASGKLDNFQALFEQFAQAAQAAVQQLIQAISQIAQISA